MRYLLIRKLHLIRIVFLIFLFVMMAGSPFWRRELCSRSENLAQISRYHQTPDEGQFGGPCLLSSLPAFAIVTRDLVRQFNHSQEARETAGLDDFSVGQLLKNKATPWTNGGLNTLMPK